jgi:hypothetical protein
VPELHESGLGSVAEHATATPPTGGPSPEAPSLAPPSVAAEHSVADTVTVVLADACPEAAMTSPACPDASVTVAVYVVLDDGQT